MTTLCKDMHLTGNAVLLAFNGKKETNSRDDAKEELCSTLVFVRNPEMQDPVQTALLPFLEWNRYLAKICIQSLVLLDG